MYGFINQQYGQRWGPFAAGSLMAIDPGRRALPLPAALDRQRPDRRARSRDEPSASRGVPTRCSTEPHHDGSDLYVARAARRARRRRGRPPAAAARDAAPTACSCATSATASRAASRRRSTRRPTTDVWWRAEFPLANPVTRYRWLLSGGERRLRVGERARPHGARGRRRRRLRDHGRHVGPRLAPRLGRLPDLPRPLRVARVSTSRRPTWAMPRALGRAADRARPADAVRAYGGDLRGVEQHLDHIESLGANVDLPDAVLPGDVDAPLRRDHASTHVDPLLGGDEALALARAPRRTRAASGCSATSRSTTPATGTSGSSARAPTRDAPERDFYYFDDAIPGGYESWLGTPHAAEAQLAERRAARALLRGASPLPRARPRRLAHRRREHGRPLPRRST